MKPEDLPTNHTMTHDEKITILQDAPRIVAVAIERGWAKRPPPTDGTEPPHRKKTGPTAGVFQEPVTDQPRDEEMVAWRRARNLSQVAAARQLGVCLSTWQAVETLRSTRKFTLP